MFLRAYTKNETVHRKQDSIDFSSEKSLCTLEERRSGKRWKKQGKIPRRIVSPKRKKKVLPCLGELTILNISFLAIP